MTGNPTIDIGYARTYSQTTSNFVAKSWANNSNDPFYWAAVGYI